MRRPNLAAPTSVECGATMTDPKAISVECGPNLAVPTENQQEYEMAVPTENQQEYDNWFNKITIYEYSVIYKLPVV